MILGTVGYMSPEQVRGEEVDARSDIFNLGLILYEVLSGSRAFRANSSIETAHAILKDSPSPLPDTIPDGLQQIVSRCLEKDPGNRFQSASDAEFALGLVDMQAGGRISHGSGRPESLGRIVWLSASVLLLIAAGFAAHWWWRSPEPRSE